MISTMMYATIPVLVIGILRKCASLRWYKFQDKTSLEGKVAIVTGANSGIGKETVRGLVDRHAKVIMACRDIMDARKAILDIRKTTKNGYMVPLYLDLSSFQSIRMFINVVLQDFKEIHILINNAGIAMPKKTNTVDGFEYNFGVNYLGHFLLTKLLLERLKECGPSRVVILSSKLMRFGVIDFSNLNSEKSFDASSSRRLSPYCNSKLLNAYFGHELALRTSGTGVSVYTVCPGFSYTRLFRYSRAPWYRWLLFIPVGLFVMRTSKQASQTVLHCAISDKVKDQSGLVYRDGVVMPSKFDQEVSTRLWKVTEEMIQSVGRF